jgi:hypothetical protein
MTTISTTDVSNGATISAATINNNFTAVKTAVNGNIDNANIVSTAAIAISKLAAYPSDATKVLKGDGSWGIPPAAWTSYTPSWTSSGTAPAIGNGTIVGAYTQFGKMVTVLIQMVAGSTTTFGTGNYLWSVPVSGTTAGSITAYYGSGLTTDSSTNSIWRVAGVVGISTTAIAYFTGTAGAYQVGAAAPFTWANGDSISMTISYAVA